jgi:hypothetical protein
MEAVKDYVFGNPNLGSADLAPIQSLADIDHSLVYLRLTLRYALFVFNATLEGQLDVLMGEPLELLDDSNSYWWLVRCLETEQVGYIPAENIENPNERLARLNRRLNLESAAVRKDDELKETHKILRNVTFDKEHEEIYPDEYDIETLERGEIEQLGSEMTGSSEALNQLKNITDSSDSGRPKPKRGFFKKLFGVGITKGSSKMKISDRNSSISSSTLEDKKGVNWTSSPGLVVRIHLGEKIDLLSDFKAIWVALAYDINIENDVMIRKTLTKLRVKDWQQYEQYCFLCVKYDDGKKRVREKFEHSENFSQIVNQLGKDKPYKIFIDMNQPIIDSPNKIESKEEIIDHVIVTYGNKFVKIPINDSMLAAELLSLAMYIIKVEKADCQLHCIINKRGDIQYFYGRYDDS